jgi:hypothetical protein
MGQKGALSSELTGLLGHADRFSTPGGHDHQRGVTVPHLGNYLCITAGLVVPQHDFVTIAPPVSDVNTIDKTDTNGVDCHPMNAFSRLARLNPNEAKLILNSRMVEHDLDIQKIANSLDISLRTTYRLIAKLGLSETMSEMLASQVKNRKTANV